MTEPEEKEKEKEIQLVGMGSATDGKDPWAPFAADLNEQLKAGVGMEKAADLTCTGRKHRPLSLIHISEPTRPY